MSQAGESVVVERVAEEPGLEPSRSREEAASESREREGRRAGIILVVIGCLLMALAAGEAAVADTNATDDTPTQASTVLVL